MSSTPRCRWFITDPPGQCLGHKPLGLPEPAPALCQRHLDAISRWIEIKAYARADQLLGEEEFRALRAQRKGAVPGAVVSVSPDLTQTLTWLTSRPKRPGDRG